MGHNNNINKRYYYNTRTAAVQSNSTYYNGIIIPTGNILLGVLFIMDTTSSSTRSTLFLCIRDLNLVTYY